MVAWEKSIIAGFEPACGGSACKSCAANAIQAIGKSNRRGNEDVLGENMDFKRGIEGIVSPTVSVGMEFVVFGEAFIAADADVLAKQSPGLLLPAIGHGI